MPCRAPPPPPPPPHSTLDLTPSPSSLSSPLVYRLRTCCLQEFLPRVSISPLPTEPWSSSTAHHTTPASRLSTHSSTTPISISTPPTSTSRLASQNIATQLCALFNNKTSGLHLVNNPLDNNRCNGTSPCACNNTNNAHHDPSLSPSLDTDCPSHRGIHTDATEDTSSCSLTHTLSQWQPPASNIPLAHLQSALAHRFLKYAVAEGLIQDQVRGDTCHIKPLIDIDQSSVSELQAHSGPTYNAANPHTNKVQMSMEAAGQTWAAAHDLVWPEGDYYKAQKITIREGVAHLKRGRRYIFVEPVLGPGAPYLYPSRACDTMDEEVQVESATEEHRRPSSDLHRSHDHDHDDASRHEHSALADSEHGTDAAVGGTESEQTHNPDQDKGHEQDQDDDNVDTDNAAQSTTGSSSSSTSTSHAMVSHENADSAVTTAPTSDASTNVSDHSNSAFRHDPHGLAFHPTTSSFSPSLEPYSPLLDPSTDGQDQFEYGLYELHYVPKIQYLLPHQFLPTQQSFIVHLDEDRPTLASPVPLHSNRPECRCQLMMRKALIHRDLQQVWPLIPPVRTALERLQEAEEEARIMEIKKVQKSWRATLQTEMVACG